MTRMQAAMTEAVKETPAKQGKYRFSDEDFLPYYQQWAANPGKKAMSAMLNKLRPLINYAVDFYSSGPAPESLRVSAKRIAVDAIKSYKQGAGSFVNHLMIHLKRLQRIGPEVKQIIPIPERVRIDLTALNQAEAELSEKLGREPSTAELADYTGLSMKRIERIRKKVVPSVPQSHATVSTEEGSMELPTKPLDKDDETSSNLLEYLYIDASPQEQYIIENYYGIHGRKPVQLSQIAKKLGCSTATVSRRLQELEQRLGEWSRYLSAGLARRR